VNTISTYTNRRKYALAQIDTSLRHMLVAEAVCKVDRSDVRYIDNPYGSAPSTVVQAVAGTYTPAALTTTDAGLTVADEFIVSEHIYDFESALSAFDLYSSRIDEMTFSVKAAIDKWVVNELCENGTGTYSTPSGGFTTPSNWTVILSNIISQSAAYADRMNGLYLILEDTDLVGVIQSQMSSGFNFADSALRNGLVSNQAGVDIYVVPSGTYADETTSTTSGTKTWTNDGHRVGGVKNTATYAAPRGVQYDEKGVSGKTGKEVVVWGYVGFKAWVPRVALSIDITVTA